MRQLVASAVGLGRRLANSWRDRHYRNQKLDAASLIYTKPPQIIRAFDEGATNCWRPARLIKSPTPRAVSHRVTRELAPPLDALVARRGSLLEAGLERNIANEIGHRQRVRSAALGSSAAPGREPRT
jgi:hypothetical protein